MIGGVCCELLTHPSLLQVPELKKKVAELGLPTKGTKAELLARVEKYLHEQGVQNFLCIGLHDSACVQRRRRRSC